MDYSSVFLVLLGLIGGLALTVIPVAPAGLTVPAALVLVLLLRGWHAVPWWCWVVQVAFVMLLFAIDNVMHAFGAARLGASRDAMVWGGTAVVVAPIGLGMLFGPIGGIVGAPLGAVVGTVAGELRSRARTENAAGTGAAAGKPRLAHLGIAAFAAWIAGLLVRTGLVTVQAIIAVIAVWNT